MPEIEQVAISAGNAFADLSENRHKAFAIL